MITYTRKGGSTDVSVTIRIIDSTDGTPETGVTSATTGLDLQYRREGAASTAITESDLAALTTAHTDGGMKHIGNGYYRLDLPDAAVASGVAGCLVHGTATGMVVIGCYIEIVAYDPQDTVRLGLTALPNAAADAAGGLVVSDAGGLDIDALNTNVSAILTDTSTAGVVVDWSAIVNATATKSFTNTTIAVTSAVTGNVSGTVGGIAGTITTLDALDTAQDSQHATTQASLATVDTNVDAILVDTADMQPKLGTLTDLGSGATVAGNLSDMAGATFATSTDSLEAIRNRGDAAWTTGAGGTPPDLLVSTTIATLASQTSFTLTSGSADDDAYNGALAVVTDSATSTQKAVGQVNDYVGSTRTVTLTADPAIFTMAVGDSIAIVAVGQATASVDTAAIADAVWDEALSGHVTAGTAGKAVADIETDATAILADTGTDGVVLAAGQTVASVSGAVGSVTGTVGGIAGTITTLDALDTAQDSQHSTTQAAVAALNDPTAAAIADAVLDEALSGHVTAGTLGKAIADIETDATAILDDTGTSGVVLAAGQTVASVSGTVGGIAGTLTTLDALDTAQDSQHSTTQAAVAALNDPTAAAIADAVLDEALSGHVTAGTLGKAVADIETDATAILADTGTDGVVVASGQTIDANAIQISGSATAADQLEAHALTVPAVTFSGGTTTTAVLALVGGSAASSTDDVYNSRLLVFNAGTLDRQVAQITDYVGSTKTATITAVTTAVTSGHTAILV